MADNKVNQQNEEENNDENMTVELELDCGKVVCKIVTILTVEDTDYIVLCPEKNPLCDEGEVWFYRYTENPDDPNEEPELEYIEDDAEYERVEDAFDEYLDNIDFEEES